MDLIAVFRLFVRTLPIHFALLGRKRKYIKSKTTAKLKEKRTSIAGVRDILRMFDTFPNPLLSRCRQPLRPQSIGLSDTVSDSKKLSVAHLCMEYWLTQADISRCAGDNLYLMKMQFHYGPLLYGEADRDKMVTQRPEAREKQIRRTKESAASSTSVSR
jgi:hypothetical protein